jgi:hypothetical protein
LLTTGWLAIELAKLIFLSTDLTVAGENKPRFFDNNRKPNVSCLALLALSRHCIKATDSKGIDDIEIGLIKL